MDSNIVAQFAPYLGPAVMVAGTVLFVVSVFQIISQIEKWAQPKARRRS